ncbi:hypothetical protein R5R35_004882 [Gryllus longicercus]|uniref:Sodium channel protein Nach n=1 Tax=Gryllus longicercus TaxID=2509291 RepID=A0AAN9V713_9ORTH
MYGGMYGGPQLAYVGGPQPPWPRPGAEPRGHGGGGKKLASRCRLLRTSLSYQTKQFFDNSTLHGVRYIREEGRPFCERFMWFCFTSIGGVATLIIIASLWEKFQTNPTITGLDTDFHNWDVPFPAVALCPVHAGNRSAIEEYVQANYEGDPDVLEFLNAVANFSYRGIPAFKNIVEKKKGMLTDKPLREYQKMFVKSCEGMFLKCELRAQSIDCCDYFLPMPTEVGFCYVSNSRLAYVANNNASFSTRYIRETDEKWALKVDIQRFPEKGPVEPILVYIQSNDEAPIVDVSPQHEWMYQLKKLSFSAKQTYTTSEARQLSIRQRRCVFPDEIKLDTDSIYTYTSCMSQCRLRRLLKLCGCAPFFYATIKNKKICGVDDLGCLVEKNAKLLDESKSCKCELGCMNTVYEVEKLEDGPSRKSSDIEMSFVSWPIVRYKREVLFGWVDLLVSFGGIAGLFLGFSLLSGVEIVYYFTMRACCMLLRDADELRRLQHEAETAPRPPLDLALTPYFLQPQPPPRGEKGAQAGVTRVKPVLDAQPAPVGRFYPQPRHGVLRRPYLLEYLP